MASHTTSEKDVFEIPGTEVDECPVSLVSPQAFELVQIFNRAGYAKESGAALYSPNLSKWPSRMVDALVVIEQASIAEHNARFDAEK